MFKHRLLLQFALALGLFQWLLWTTGYAWDSTLAQYLFPAIIGFIGLKTWAHLNKLLPKDQVFFKILPAITAGLPVLVMGAGSLLVLICFPLALFFVPLMLVDGEVVGTTLSPDGNKIAIAYYRADLAISADSGDIGRVTISMKYRWLPLLRQKMYSYSTDDSERFVTFKWKDKVLVANNLELPIKVIAWRLPYPFQDYEK